MQKTENTISWACPYNYEIIFSRIRHAYACTGQDHLLQPIACFGMSDKIKVSPPGELDSGIQEPVLIVALPPAFWNELDLSVDFADFKHVEHNGESYMSLDGVEKSLYFSAPEMGNFFSQVKNNRYITFFMRGKHLMQIVKSLQDIPKNKCPGEIKKSNEESYLDRILHRGEKKIRSFQWFAKVVEYNEI